ncbi:hypothetical protein JNB91_19875 [Rhizobium wenxiniae]|uniref:DUF6680 family protein n=1 Tax=Rhizobium wenxiniae TaxID=1737357 RepID=UPI001C6F28D4|nr:DUF6680 family protein [Rhizobium wenxiniae]MBW9090071.1 hypothetical protein [Rhizobium wenxiniae]
MSFDWSKVDWAVVLATFVGPIVAVGITLWYQERSSRNKSREDLFVSMMRTRRMPTNIEFVGALNLVPVHFWKDKLVMQRYSELMAVFSDPSWNVIDARLRLIEQVELKVAYLLSELSKAVGRPVEQLEILRGAYAPQGWKDEEQAQADLRSALAQLLSGARALPVFVLSGTPSVAVGADDDGVFSDKSDQ